MVADFFTKPLQASQFRRLRRIIMGLDPISILELSKNDVPSPNERVGDIKNVTDQNSVMPQSQLKVGEGNRYTEN